MTRSPVPLRGALDLLPAYVPGRRPRSAAGAALAANENHAAPPSSVQRRSAASLQRMNRYPDAGAALLRDRLAARLGVDSDEIVVGPGSIGVLHQILTAVCEPGDEVVFAWRSFEAYPVIATLVGAVPVAIPLDDADDHDLSAMVAAVGPRTRAIIVCAPNNPTGIPVPVARLREMLRCLPSDTLVVIDEAYVEYVDASSSSDGLALWREHANVVVLRTFSKAWGLAGLRVGYAVAVPALADAFRRVGLPFAVSEAAQTGAIEALAHEDAIIAHVDAVRHERERMSKVLRGLGHRPSPSQANFVWLRMAPARRRRVIELFDRADIVVRTYDDDGVRITVADPQTNDRVLATFAEEASQ